MKMTEMPNGKQLLPPKVSYEDFLEVSKRIKVSLGNFPEELRRYEEFTKKFGEKG